MNESNVLATWTNTCVEMLGSEEGRALAEGLAAVLKENETDEARTEQVRLIVRSQSAPFAKTTQKLVQKLTRDYYNSISQDSVLADLGNNRGGAFESLGSLTSAMEAGATQLEAILAGKQEAPDIDVILAMPKAEVVDKAVELGATPREAAAIVNNFYLKLAEAHMLDQARKITLTLRVDALTHLFESARQTGIYHG